MSGEELFKILLYSGVGIYVVLNVDSIVGHLGRIADALEKLTEERK